MVISTIRTPTTGTTGEVIAYLIVLVGALDVAVQLWLGSECVVTHVAVVLWSLRCGFWVIDSLCWWFSMYIQTLLFFWTVGVVITLLCCRVLASPVLHQFVL